MNPRILVVEDDLPAQELISRYLAENHFEVRSVMTAALVEPKGAVPQQPTHARI